VPACLDVQLVVLKLRLPASIAPFLGAFAKPADDSRMSPWVPNSSADTIPMYAQFQSVPRRAAWQDVPVGACQSVLLPWEVNASSSC
jgi:hypothetical protein